MKTTTMILGLALSSLTLPCYAADMPLRGPIPFAAMDSNGDNMISPQEYVDAHNLRKKDRQQAGMPEQRKATPSFTDFDSNADSMISQQELEQGREAMGRNGQRRRPNQPSGGNRGRNMPSFADFDLNGDGVLEKEEFYDARAQRMVKRAEQGYQLRNADKAPAFETVDNNNDGKINEKEFSAHQAQHQMMRGR